MIFLSKLRQKLSKRKHVTARTPLVHKNFESKNSMTGSVYGKQLKTCGEWQAEYTRKADFIDS